ncbi:YcaO-like family protein [Haloarcula sp. S1CR25-12]|uniref:YcaO-like family protein n=1 Tax=Haloarcula saliterrae TaxID=2950534 RepID=A0ABU2FDL9_9EURY|nr:YcaO-like family protein [Haloarcula sp. S1CR25-12]MDS0260334.1 YcaO-like family protein [Haloarcula sp. S1CR25-12]
MNIETTDADCPPGLHRLVGAKSGLVSEVIYHLSERASPDVCQTTPSLCDLGYTFRTDRSVELQITGKGTDFQRSLVSCLGEFAERYAMSWPDPESMRRASHAALDASERVVDFDSLNPFRSLSDDGLTRETELLWSAGTDLHTGETVHVPAELVWNDLRVMEDEPSRLFSTSNGLAAGPTLQAAVLWALYELIERDGLMRTWWHHRTPQRVETAQIPALEETLSRINPDTDLSIHLLDIRSRVDVPTYCGALVSEREAYPKFLLAGSAHLDARAALREAAVEVCQGWSYAHSLALDTDPDSLEHGDTGFAFGENVCYYGSPSNFDEVSFLFGGGTVRPDPESGPPVDEWSVEKRLQQTLALLDEADCTPIAVDVTSDDIRRGGIDVARVVVPELVGLTPPSHPPTEHPDLSAADLVEKPHPFP